VRLRVGCACSKLLKGRKGAFEQSITTEEEEIAFLFAIFWFEDGA
jgi:hypothetical protein